MKTIHFNGGCSFPSCRRLILNGVVQNGDSLLYPGFTVASLLFHEKESEFMMASGVGLVQFFSWDGRYYLF